MRGPLHSDPRFFNSYTVHSVVIIRDDGVHPEPAILSPIRLTQIVLVLLNTGKVPVLQKTGKVPVLIKTGKMPVLRNTGKVPVPIST